MIGARGENTFLKVCLPLDESETALASEKDEPCSTKAKYVEKEKQKNEDYIKKIKSNNFFKKSKKPEMVKLLPGEQMKTKTEADKIALSAQGMRNDAANLGQFSTNGNQSQFPQMNFPNNTPMNFSNNNQMNFPNQFMNMPMNNNLNQNANPAMMQLMNSNLNMANDKLNNMVNNFSSGTSQNFNTNNQASNSFSFKQAVPQGIQDQRIMQFNNGQQNGVSQFLQNQIQPQQNNQMNQLQMPPQGNQIPIDQMAELKNQIAMLTQQLNQRNQQIEELMKKNQQPQFLTQGDKAFFSKPQI